LPLQRAGDWGQCRNGPYESRQQDQHDCVHVGRMPRRSLLNKAHRGVSRWYNRPVSRPEA
jgi:hypothetical protein